MDIIPVDVAEIDVEGAQIHLIKRLGEPPILFRVQRLRVENRSSNLSFF